MTCNEYIMKLNGFLTKLPIQYFVIPYLIHFVCTDILINNAPAIDHHPPLHDVLISRMPDLTKYGYVVNILVGIIFLFEYYFNIMYFCNLPHFTGP